jgi:hypothetical protein
MVGTRVGAVDRGGVATAGGLTVGPGGSAVGLAGGAGAAGLVGALGAAGVATGSAGDG